ncbi:hypothetical protein BKA93DRAFT_91460 [Sparassis latifolia]
MHRIPNADIVHGRLAETRGKRRSRVQYPRMLYAPRVESILHSSCSRPLSKCSILVSLTELRDPNTRPNTSSGLTELPACASSARTVVCELPANANAPKSNKPNGSCVNLIAACAACVKYAGVCLACARRHHGARCITQSLCRPRLCRQGLVAHGFLPSNVTEARAIPLSASAVSSCSSRTRTPAHLWGRWSSSQITTRAQNYQGRIYEYAFVLQPYYGTNNRWYDDAAETLQLTYLSTMLHHDRGHVNTIGLDTPAVRAAMAVYPQLPDADPHILL